MTESLLPDDMLECPRCHDAYIRVLMQAPFIDKLPEWPECAVCNNFRVLTVHDLELALVQGDDDGFPRT